MKADAHRQAAEDLEYTIAKLQGDPRAARSIIENAWGAAFHWIVYGCIRKYTKHFDKHQGLYRNLRQLNEGDIAQAWLELENLRGGGWYNYQTTDADIQLAIDLMNQIHAWATT
jgi:hypothetical protein